MQNAPLAVAFCVLPPAYCVLHTACCKDLTPSLIPTVKADQFDSPYCDTRKMIEKGEGKYLDLLDDIALLLVIPDLGFLVFFSNRYEPTLELHSVGRFPKGEKEKTKKRKKGRKKKKRRPFRGRN